MNFAPRLARHSTISLAHVLICEYSRRPPPQVSATSGYQVTLVDLNPDVLTAAQASISKNLQRVAKKQFKDSEADQTKFVQEALQRVHTSTDVTATVAATDLVIEAIVENMKVKHELFAAIDKVR